MYKSNINLNLYKNFYEVAKYGSISEAAKQTYSSQPAVSKSIKKLESDLNVKLFYRTLNGVELTDKGKELLFFVEKSFNNLVIAERQMIEDNNLERGKLSIGMPSNVGSFYLFDSIVEFHKKYPNVEITIITGSSSKLMSLLDSHIIDFFIDTAPINTKDSDSLSIVELTSVKYSFIAKKDTKIKGINNIKKLKDLKNKQLILPIPGTANRNDLDKLFFDNNIEIENILNIHTSEMIIAAVKKDLGIGYVIENLADNDIQILKITEDLPTVEIDLVYNKNYLTTSSIKFINNYLKDMKTKL
ncbi:MAG: LysR family transcriptional regulator [Ruminococcus sp.]|nr:LysR family transcriptional regulator [Ruminococcus sp.]